MKRRAVVGACAVGACAVGAVGGLAGFLVRLSLREALDPTPIDDEMLCEQHM
jgi:hypothetical protein